MQHVMPSSLDAYTSALKLSMDDKLFFADRIPDDVTVFVDHGCADGALLWELMVRRHGKPGSWSGQYLGFDIDPQMVRAAEVRWQFSPHADFTDNLDRTAALLTGLHREGRKSCLVLSSVVHEVLSQGKTFERFWIDVVLKLGCDYVVFRDMAVESKASIGSVPAGWYNELWAHLDHEDTARAVSFEQTHGNLLRRDAFLHFLLKAVHPVEDWGKEVTENYLPHSAEAYLNRMTVGSGHKLSFFEHTPLLALQEEWQRRFGFWVPDPTHLKIILKKGW